MFWQLCVIVKSLLLIQILIPIKHTNMPKTYRKGTKRKILFIYFEYTKFLTVPVQNYETTERKKLMAGLAVL